MCACVWQVVEREREREIERVCARVNVCSGEAGIQNREGEPRERKTERLCVSVCESVCYSPVACQVDGYLVSTVIHLRTPREKKHNELYTCVREETQ